MGSTGGLARWTQPAGRKGRTGPRGHPPAPQRGLSLFRLSRTGRRPPGKARNHVKSNRKGGFKRLKAPTPAVAFGATSSWVQLLGGGCRARGEARPRPRVPGRWIAPQSSLLSSLTETRASRMQGPLFGPLRQPTSPHLPETHPKPQGLSGLLEKSDQEVPPDSLLGASDSRTRRERPQLSRRAMLSVSGGSRWRGTGEGLLPQRVCCSQGKTLPFQARYMLKEGFLRVKIFGSSSPGLNNTEQNKCIKLKSVYQAI